MSTTKGTLVDDGKAAFVELLSTDAVVATVWAALRLAEEAHVDNTGMACDVRRNRDDCCRNCSTAEALRAVLRDELDVEAWWRDGRTVLLSKEEGNLERDRLSASRNDK